MEKLAQLTRVSAEVFRDGRIRIHIRFLDSGDSLALDGDGAHRLGSEILRVLDRAERAAHGVTFDGLRHVESVG